MCARTSKSSKVTIDYSRRHTSLSTSRRILQKTSHRRLRQPLAIRNVSNGARTEQLHATVLPELPRSLAKPQVGDVDRMPIESAYPELADIPTDYIRKGLMATGADMLAAVANVHAQPPQGTLPKELEIVVNDVVAAHCPTHMLAIYSGTPAVQKRKVTLFPTHHLVLAAHCNNLPTLPASNPNTNNSTVKVPIVPLCLPSPETFSILQTYLYTKRIDVLLATLLPAPPSSLSEPNVSLPDMIKRLVHHLAAAGNIPALARRGMIINAVWRNTCALGVYDDKLWGSIKIAWEAVVSAMDMIKGQC